MQPLPSDAEPRPPADFASVLATKDPVLLVGGQAVNLWALYYEDRTADLAPFVSRDVDVLGDRETLTALGESAGAKPQFFPIRPPSNEVGVVIAKDAKGLPLLVEVLRYVNGASNEELREPAYTVALGKGEVRVKLPGPIALLKAKISNVAELKQDGRQDARHLAILTRLLPAYLNDLRKAVVEGRLNERKFVQALERLLSVVASKIGRKALAATAIDPRSVFADLDPGKLPKVRAFLEERAPRVLSR
jgi:hypothetical protein